MGLLTRFAHSSDLVAGMAERVGLDLTVAPGQDPESAARSYRAMVMRCSTCGSQKQCERLQRRFDHLDEPPAYCRNRLQMQR